MSFGQLTHINTTTSQLDDYFSIRPNMINWCCSDVCTVYHTAAKNSMIDVLVEANEYELNIRDDDGRTPLHYAALKGHLRALKVILSHGGKVNKTDHFGNSALHYAVRSRNIKCVKFLINFEPKLIWMMDINNLNARDLAEILEYEEIIKVLDKFLKEQDLSKYAKFQQGELKRAQKRREKYSILMEHAAKSQLDEYRKKKLFRFRFGSKDYLAFDRIVFDENVVLSSSSSSSSASSPHSYSINNE